MKRITMILVLMILSLNLSFAKSNKEDILYGDEDVFNALISLSKYLKAEYMEEYLWYINDKRCSYIKRKAYEGAIKYEKETGWIIHYSFSIPQCNYIYSKWGTELDTRRDINFLDIKDSNKSHILNYVPWDNKKEK